MIDNVCKSIPSHSSQAAVTSIKVERARTGDVQLSFVDHTYEQGQRRPALLAGTTQTCSVVDGQRGDAGDGDGSGGGRGNEGDG